MIPPHSTDSPADAAVLFRWQTIRYSFPIRLVLLHLSRNDARAYESSSLALTLLTLNLGLSFGSARKQLRFLCLPFLSEYYNIQVGI